MKDVAGGAPPVPVTPRTAISGDIWGGISAMLVALPSAIAFGVTIFGALGGAYAGRGALAGILGATALGLVAPALGGTQRLITAPCAPAAAVLSALALGFVQQGNTADTALVMLAIVATLTGLIQIAFGFAGIGRLIKYMPFPVVSGYLTGVGLIIILGQLPKLLGVAKGVPLAHALVTPVEWEWHALVVGMVTMVAVIAGPRVTRAVPATIFGLVAGIAAYFVLAIGHPPLLTLTGNRSVVGPLGVEAGVFTDFGSRIAALRTIDLSQLTTLLVPAVSLAVLLSIDTLKTCLVTDAITRSRHNSNRELVAQGCANLASTLVGGVPGAGTMGATLVNISGGARSRLSGVIEGVAALLALVALSPLLAWIPMAALAGVLIVVGVRMFDRHSLQLLKSRGTRLDFAVIVAVVIVAETVSLIAASAVGVGLAILLYVREQTHTSVVWRRVLGNEMFSKQVRVPAEMKVLEREGAATAILELQGGLFFGTADSLYSSLEPELTTRRHVILDLGRVQSLDTTAVHVLDIAEDTLRASGGKLFLSRVPRALPTGADVGDVLRQSGILDPGRARVFHELDAALECAENEILSSAQVARGPETPLELHELALFAG
ncbi:MAG TPA: SulP family inorganic anion transporter, partial [Gemmatimonadaceae bacterium]|nr:SulP family inorganic anion transporter [Gemmatimonadaceae bacterium]